MHQSEKLQSFAVDIRQAIEAFSRDEAEAKSILNGLAASDPGIFFAAAIRVVAAAKPSEGLRYLILTLGKDKRLSAGLLDPGVCTVEEALAVTRAVAETGVQLQAAFEIALNKALQGQSSPKKAELISRLLDILAQNGDQSCWNSLQVELMAYPDKVVRAKAALLIGRSTRNVAWIARRLLDRDPRVQASAVEALWGLDPEQAKPHYLSALKSPNNRVAVNAALGLYLSGDVTATRLLLELLRHPDSRFQLSALWAMGRTRDERFLPALTEFYKHATGKLRLAAVGAMSNIRRRDLTAHKAGELRVHISQASRQSGGARRLAFGLSCHPARDLSAIKPSDFAVWERGTLIEDYHVRLASPPAVLLAGFVAPWAASSEEPYEKAICEALKQCLCMKRHDDLWRIDRYSVEINPPADGKAQDFLVPYDDSLVTAELRASQGCILDPALMAKAIALPAPRDRAAADALAALERQCDILAKRAGKRHVFLFLHEMSGAHLREDAILARIRTMAQESSVVLHGVCPDIAGKWLPLRDICLSNPEGSFLETNLEGMVDGLVDAYANLNSRYEITYTLPAPAEPQQDQSGSVKLKISSEQGYGECEFVLDATPPSAPAAEPATPAAVNPAPPAEAPVQPVS